MSKECIHFFGPLCIIDRYVGCNGLVSILSRNSSVRKFIYKRIQQVEYLDVNDNEIRHFISDYKSRRKGRGRPVDKLGKG